jgi:hypothetical protein
MNFRFNLILPLVLLMTYISSFAQFDGLASKWQGKNFTPFTEIPRSEYWYNGEEKVLYLVSNDDNNLYLHLRVIDKVAIRKIVDFGLTVWIDTRGKNKKKSGIVFPIEKKKRASSLQLKEERVKGKRPEKKEENPPLDHQFDIQLINIDGKRKTELISATVEGDVNGQMTYNDMAELEYHLKIPLKRINLLSLNERYVTFNVESGSLDLANASPGGGGGQNGGGGSMQGGHPSSGGRGQQRGGQQGGGPSGGGDQQRGNAEMQAMSTAVKIKLKKVKLAENR